MSNKWSDNLRNRMDTHQEPAPDGLWDDIEMIVSKEDPEKTLPKRNKILLWGKYIGAVAAALLIILFIADYLMIERSDEFAIITQKQETVSESENDLGTDINVEDKLIADRSDDKVSSQMNKNVASSATNAEQDIVNLGVKVEEYKDPKSESEPNNVESQPKTPKKSCRNTQTANGGNNNIGVGHTTDVPMLKQKSRSTKWETSIYASNISSDSNKKSGGYGSFTEGDVFIDEEGSPLIDDDPQTDILLQNKYREVYTDIKHQQPITVGVSVSYGLGDKWSLTSGLTYSILSSKLRSGSENYYYTSKQTLHNIGIPLNINYNVWKNKKVATYVSVGGSVEKNVSGKLVTDYIIDNHVKSTQTDNVSVDQLQWSANTSVGIQYNFSQKIALYAEPGASYYFKNGSDVETIYKEKPLNLSLKIGLRFSLNE